MNDPVFLELVGLVFDVEGGYSNDPEDPGGPTKYGIAWNYNVEALKKLGFVNPTDIERLSKDQALDIYWNHYWLPSGAAELVTKSKRLAYLHFDTFVNGGGSLIMKRLSKNPKDFEGYPHNEVLWLKLFFEYLLKRALYFTSRGRWARFGRGWIIKRIVKVGLKGLEMES
jgi:hypothetical protein